MAHTASVALGAARTVDKEINASPTAVAYSLMTSQFTVLCVCVCVCVCEYESVRVCVSD